MKRIASSAALQSCAILALTLVAAAPAPALAQAGTGIVIRDEPTAIQPPTQQRVPEESHGIRKFFQAVCWYIPNRIVDLTDIPRLYITAGDGMGASVRATKLLNATWFQDSAFGLGWTMRQPPFFSEQISERYLGFLMAQQGELDRDPSEIGLSVHFIALGANAAVSLSEAADFVLGFVGVDLRADDHGPVLGLDKSEKPQPAIAEANAVPAPEPPPAAMTATPIAPPAEPVPAAPAP